MFNDFEPKPNEFTMTEHEIKSHKKVFSRLCLAFLAYILIADGLSIALSFILNATSPDLLNNANFTLILSSVIQYLIAFPVLWAILRKMPTQAPFEYKLGAKGFLKYATISVFLMYVGNYISSYLMVYIENALGRTTENVVNTVLDESNIILSLIFVGIIGPIIEEIMFRKLFIDRLTPYGEVIAILFPSLVFGLFHCNLYQFFYAFLLGVIFSYVYLRTGKIIYSTILHIFINVFFGILPSAIFANLDLDEFIEIALSGNIPEEYIMANLVPLIGLIVYEFISYGFIIAGLVFFIRNLRHTVLSKGSVKFPKGVAAEVIFFNISAIILITVCLILTAINIFAV